MPAEISKEEFARLRDALNREMEENGTFLGANMLAAPSMEVRQPLLTILAALDLAASASSPEPEEWLPIKTAPKDGQLIILDCLGGSIGKWETSKPGDKIQLVPGGWAVCVFGESAWGYGSPDFWRPILAPPASRHSDGERR